MSVEVFFSSNLSSRLCGITMPAVTLIISLGFPVRLGSTALIEGSFWRIIIFRVWNPT